MSQMSVPTFLSVVSHRVSELQHCLGCDKFDRNVESVTVRQKCRKFENLAGDPDFVRSWLESNESTRGTQKGYLLQHLVVVDVGKYS